MNELKKWVPTSLSVSVMLIMALMVGSMDDRDGYHKLMGFLLGLAIFIPLSFVLARIGHTL